MKGISVLVALGLVVSGVTYYSRNSGKLSSEYNLKNINGGISEESGIMVL